MGKCLVVAEKHSVAMDLARVLNCRTSGDGFVSNERYVVTWCVGHLVGMAMPDEIDEKYKEWKLEHLPIIPEKFMLLPLKETIKQYKVVEKLMNDSSIDTIINSCDSAREGELIFRNIINKTNCKKRCMRLWISSQTDEAIEEGFDNIKPSSYYDNLYYSALSRAEADWLVGLNGTRAFSSKFGIKLPIGRVQTAVLAIIVKRHFDIKNFKPNYYWQLTSLYSDFKGSWYDEKQKESRIFDKERAIEIANKIKGKVGEVIDVQKKKKKESSPLFYDLTQLQRECNRLFGFTGKKTLIIAQALYEKHKATTYPRTDSRYISTDIIPTLEKRLMNINVEPYSEFIEPLLMKGSPNLISNKVVDNSKIQDHHAIIPTEKKLDLSSFSSDERKVYDLIARNFISAFYPLYEYEATTIRVLAEGETFISRGKIEISKGWKILKNTSRENKKNKEEEQVLPTVNKGDKLPIKDVVVKDGKTSSSPPYTEDTLLDAMEHCGREIPLENEEDMTPEELADYEEYKRQLSELKIGTTATRADIIPSLKESKYVYVDDNHIYPTVLGIKLISIMPKELQSPDMTGRWERCLTQIAQGKMQRTVFMDSIKRFTNYLVQIAKDVDTERVDIKKEDGGNGKMAESLGRCPECKKGNIIERDEFYGCDEYSNGCKFYVKKKQPLFERYKKKLTPTVMKSLLKENNHTIILKSCKSPNKANTTFDVEIGLVHADNKYWNIKFNFEDKDSDNSSQQTEIIGKCPDSECNGSIQYNERSGIYTCDACNFKMYQKDFFLEKYKKKLGKTLMKDLLASPNKDIEISGLTSASNKKFPADGRLSKSEKGNWFVKITFRTYEK
jgi:DNA topoisomerase-3